MVAIGIAVEDRVLQRLAADDSVDSEMLLVDDVTSIGRAGPGFAFPDDADMADLHAEMCLGENTVVVRDPGHGSGIWLRVVGSEGRLLRAGDQVWLGAQVLVIRHDDEGWQVRHHGPDGRFKESHLISAGGVLIGRVSDLALDPADSRLSRRHAQVVPESDGLRLYDRGAHNGTYVKVIADEPLSSGDEFRLANCRFRYVVRSRGESEPSLDSEELDAASTASNLDDAETDEATVVLQSEESVAVEADSPSGAKADAAPSGEHKKPRRGRGLGARLRRMGRQAVGKRTASEPPPAPVDIGDATIVSSEIEPEVVTAESVLVVIDSDEGSVSLEVSPGKTVLEAVQEAGLERGAPVDWECGDGGCGVCVVAVVEGADRLDPPDPSTGEMKTIQITEQVVPDPTLYRLACLARVRGTVRLRKM